jgi:1,4-alpha-glucan branching enzyme
MTPLALSVVTAAALVLTVLPWTLQRSPVVSPPTGGDAAAVVYVQFTLQAPGARSVAVSGDFNQWAADATMEDADGDGVWTVRVALEPGLHEYMFVIDGDRWVTDPQAQRYADDGFGNRNAVLAVALPERSS